MILNLTQHEATPEQIAQGVVDLPDSQRQHLIRLLTVNECPSLDNVLDRCNDIAQLACYNGLGGDNGDDPHPAFAMIGGAPAMMAPLEKALQEVGISPKYSFSRRVSAETVMPDGTIRKINEFKHIGWWMDCP